ncbi:hypothetical protein D3C86_1284320 [compost metagenome]
MVAPVHLRMPVSGAAHFRSHLSPDRENDTAQQAQLPATGLWSHYGHGPDHTGPDHKPDLVSWWLAGAGFCNGHGLVRCPVCLAGQKVWHALQGCYCTDHFNIGLYDYGSMAVAFFSAGTLWLEGRSTHLCCNTDCTHLPDTLLQLFQRPGCSSRT